MERITKQIDDIFFWAAKLNQKIDAPLKVLKKANDHSDELARNYERVKGDIFKSENENINRLRALAITWEKKVNFLATKDENYFFEISGFTALSKEAIHQTISFLEIQKMNISKIRELSHVCVSLVYTLSVSDHMDVKGLAEGLISTKWLDIEGRKKTIKSFENTIRGINRVLPKLENAMSYCRRWH